MTREEECDWLCRLRSEIYVYMPKEWLIPMNNALDMAIKDLENKPRFLLHSDGKIEQIIEPCDDAVSRQAVLKINENHHGKMPNHINFEIWNEIKALPSVLPKREKSKRKSMTNQEKLSTITAEEFYDKIWWLLHEYGKRYLDSRLAIIEWLQADSEWWNAPLKEESEV